MRVLYEWLIRLYGLILRLAAGFHPRARAWAEGRRSWEAGFHGLPGSGRRIWMHCASLGEFEQGRNLLDALRARHPDAMLLVTFFSPSGFEVRRDYPAASRVAYLPLDTRRNVRRVLDLVQPDLVIFVRYEFWFNLLWELDRRQIPAVLIAARLRPGHAYLSPWLRPAFADACRAYRRVFAQDAFTEAAFASLCGPDRTEQCADTRYDRVAANRDTPWTDEAAAQLRAGRFCLVGGSVWPPDVELILEAWARLREQLPLALILAPHEIHPEEIGRWIARFPEESIRYSERAGLGPQHRILWVDNIGLLARLYRYADAAWVGGAFGTGLHNVLEPAAYGCPVFFGPRWQRFPEAGELIAAGGAQSIGSAEALAGRLAAWATDPEPLAGIRRINEQHIQSRTGATARMLAWMTGQGLA
ncbi:MAG: glycosyltransferase N-terminal domain-containing protein [Bacteroidia bacterium]|nr:glycosyltransferase N-terminal domain-containing protein [Bacteroidia bacterium]